MVTLEQDIKQWADSRWPTRTLASRLRKLGEEVGELAEAVCQAEVTRMAEEGGCHLVSNTLRREAAREAADCAIVLSDICSLLGYSLSAVMREKFAEVQQRPHGGELKGDPPTCPDCLGEIVQDVNGIGHCTCGNKPWYRVGHMGSSVRVHALHNDEMDEDPVSW
jgi:NTP pyrophosphatase (non-canonical NTP hydrolase)